MKHFKLLFFMLILTISVKAQQKVNITLLVEKEPAKEYLELLKSEIKTVLRNNYEVDFQEPIFNDFDLELAKRQYDKLNPSTTDLIIATGTTNAILFYNEENVKIPTIIVGGVNKDLIKLPIHQKTSQKNNVNYIVLPNSYTNDLTDFSSLFQYKKIGVVMNENTLKTLPVKAVFDSYFKEKSSEYDFIPLVDNKITSSLLNNFDAIYLADGFNMNKEEFQKFITEVNTRKLPSFSSNGIKDVKNGALVSNKPESMLSQLIRKIALHTESILTGTNASKLPLLIEYKNQLTINQTTSNQVGLKLRYSLLGRANIISSERSAEQLEKEISLKTLMSQVLDENLGLQVENENIALAEQDVKTSKSNYLPNVTTNVQGAYRINEKTTFSAQGNVGLKQVLYSADASAGIKIKKKLAEAQKENYSASQLDAMYNIASSYFNALVLKANVNIQNQNLQITKQNLKIANQNYDAGSSGKTDILRFRSQLAQNTQNLIDASNQFQQIKLSINQLRNFDLNSKFQLQNAELSTGLFKEYNYQTLMELLDSPELYKKLMDFFIQESLKNAPELKNLNLNSQAIDLNYTLNKNGRFIPMVALSGSYNTDLEKIGKGYDTFTPAISISLPVFNQNHRNIKQQTARIKGDQLDFQKQNLALNLEKQIQDIGLDLMGNIANIELSKISEETAKESLELSQVAYETGSIPVIQLIDAQTNYLQAQLSKSTANYQFLLTSFQLERYLGQFLIMQTPEENQEFFDRAKQFIITK